MKLSKQAIDRPRIVFVFTIVVILLALFVAMRIPVQRTPAITKAVVLVAIPFPGASPIQVEEQITKKIEDALQKLNNVDFIASSSMRGSSITQIIFLDGVEPKRARDDVAHLIDEVRSELPVGREIQPRITEIDFENTPIMLVNLSAPDDFDPTQLKEIADDVAEDLKMIEGVSNTRLFGGREREFHVNINPHLAAQKGLSITDFQRALAAFHSRLPAGSQDTGELDPTIETKTEFRGVDDIRQAILAQRGDQLIRVGDVADVRDTYRRLKNVAMLDGQTCATIIVNKESDINTLGCAEAIKQRVATFQEQYPHIQFSTTRDTSAEIAIMFRVLGSNFGFGAMLVLLILAWVMGLRISFIVLSAIPLSCAVALIFLFALDIPVSNMVIFSYILVLGMVVDGAIIVAENIHRHIELGLPPVEAAKLGIDEVSLPVIAADLTTVAAYLPMLFVPGIMGDFMGVMPKVVAVALLGSIMVDHFLIPVLAAYWYKRKEHPTPPGHSHQQHGHHQHGHPGTGHVPAHQAVEPPRKRRGFFTTLYEAILRYSLNHRWVVVSCTFLAVVAAIVTVQRIGFLFFPTSDRGQFEIRYELPLGYSIHETIRAQEAMVGALRDLQDNEERELVHFVSAIGSSEGLASRLESDAATGPEFGTIMVQLQSPLDRDRHEQLIIKELRKKIKPWPGMKMSIKEIEDGPPGGADVAVRFFGDDLEQLGRIGESVSDRLSGMKGTVDARTDYRQHNPELHIEPNPAVVGLFDMTEAQVSQAIQTAILGDTRIELSVNDEDITLRLQIDPKYKRSRTDIEGLMLTSATGRKATIGELAELRRTAGLYSVNRYNRSRAVMAKCDVEKPVIPDNIFDRLRADVLPTMGFRPIPPPKATGPAAAFIGVQDWIAEALGSQPEEEAAVQFVGEPGSLVEGIRAEFTGENEERDKNFVYLLNCMIIAVVLIFVILVVQFNSIRQSLVVQMAVPLSFVGVVLGHWAMGFPFSLASFIGLVALTGIVVNDSIVLVDFANQARRRGLNVHDALIEAGTNRLRPVILTTITTIGGLLPLLMNWSGGAEFWQPLTASIVYGLAVASLLTLLVIPVCYSLVYNWADAPEKPEGKSPSPVAHVATASAERTNGESKAPSEAELDPRVRPASPQQQPAPLPDPEPVPAEPATSEDAVD